MAADLPLNLYKVKQLRMLDLHHQRVNIASKVPELSLEVLPHQVRTAHTVANHIRSMLVPSPEIRCRAVPIIDQQHRSRLDKAIQEDNSRRQRISNSGLRRRLVSTLVHTL